MLKKGTAGILLAVLAFAVTVCHRETEEDKVRKLIVTVQKAAEEKKVNAVLEHISRSYRDAQGNDYDAVKGLLMFYFFRHRTVGVFIPTLDVSVNGASATAKFQAVLTAKGVDGEAAGIILPDALGAYTFEVSLRREESAWKVVSAKWDRSVKGMEQ